MTRRLRSAVQKPEIVIGMDISWRRPAMVVLPANWKPGDWKTIRSFAFAESRSEKTLNEVECIERTERLVTKIAGVIKHQLFSDPYSNHVDQSVHCFIEQYAYAQHQQGGHARIVEFVGALKLEVWRECGILLLPVIGTSARKLLLGRIPRSVGKVKVYVQTEVFRMGAPKEWTEDEVDAFVIANCGRSLLGLPALATA